jgi:regulator of PEP synthase PpsR (kinase-PPPase family)
MSENQTTAIWTAMQELEAAIAPLVDNIQDDEHLPAWLADLVLALSVSEDTVKAECSRRAQ